VLVRRGDCALIAKAANARAAGAGLVVIYNGPEHGESLDGIQSVNTDSGALAVFLGAASGEALRAAVAARGAPRLALPEPAPGSDKQHDAMLRDSSSGLTPDGRVKPELLCPGYKVRSACSDGDLASTQQARPAPEPLPSRPSAHRRRG
jgi:hypothetical protein